MQLASSIWTRVPRSRVQHAVHCANMRSNKFSGGLCFKSQEIRKTENSTQAAVPQVFFYFNNFREKIHIQVAISEILVGRSKDKSSSAWRIEKKKTFKGSRKIWSKKIRLFFYHVGFWMKPVFLQGHPAALLRELMIGQVQRQWWWLSW